VGNGIAIDAQGNAYVVGNDGWGTSVGCNWRVLVAKIDPSGTQALYKEDVGETGFDSGNALALDAGGNAYVTGVRPLPTS